MGKTSDVQRCQCSPGCMAVVKLKTNKYAQGHNPASRELPVLRIKGKMSASAYTQLQSRLRESAGPYATERKKAKCRYCTFTGGVRQVQRHRKDCKKSPRRSPAAWKKYMQARYKARKHAKVKA